MRKHLTVGSQTCHRPSWPSLQPPASRGKLPVVVGVTAPAASLHQHAAPCATLRRPTTHDWPQGTRDDHHSTGRLDHRRINRSCLSLLLPTLKQRCHLWPQLVPLQIIIYVLNSNNNNCSYYYPFICHNFQYFYHLQHYTFLLENGWNDQEITKVAYGFSLIN